MATFGQKVAGAYLQGRPFGMPASYDAPSEWQHVEPSMGISYGGDYTPVGKIAESSLQTLQKMGQYSTAAAKVDPMYAAYQFRNDPSQINSRLQSQYRNFLDQLQQQWTYYPDAQATLQKAGFKSPWVSFEEYLRSTSEANNPIVRQMYGNEVFMGQNRIASLLGTPAASGLGLRK